MVPIIVLVVLTYFFSVAIFPWPSEIVHVCLRVRKSSKEGEAFSVTRGRTGGDWLAFRTLQQRFKEDNLHGDTSGWEGGQHVDMYYEFKDRAFSDACTT